MKILLHKQQLIMTRHYLSKIIIENTIIPLKLRTIVSIQYKQS